MSDKPHETGEVRVLPHAAGTQLSYVLGEVRTAVGELRHDIKGMDRRVQSIERRLVGNGEVGLVTRVDRLEIQAKQDREWRREKRGAGGRIVTGIVVALVVAVLSEVWHRVRDAPAPRGETPSAEKAADRV